MMKLITKAAGSLVLAALVVAPAVAKPPPAGIWEQYHFKLANGRMKTVTQPVQIVRADVAEQVCGAELQKGGPNMAAYILGKHPELAGATFVSADCATDKSGKIKIAVGAWPAGGK